MQSHTDELRALLDGDAALTGNLNTDIYGGVPDAGRPRQASSSNTYSNQNTGDSMSSDEREDTRIYKVVVNHEGRCCINSYGDGSAGNLDV